MPPKRGTATGIARARRASKSNHKAGAGAGKSSRKILITAGEGQTGRLVIDLLATNDEYMHKYQELTALVFSEAAKSVLEEYESVKVAVFDPSDEEALVRGVHRGYLGSIRVSEKYAGLTSTVSARIWTVLEIVERESEEVEAGVLIMAAAPRALISIVQTSTAKRGARSNAVAA